MLSPSRLKPKVRRKIYSRTLTWAPDSLGHHLIEKSYPAPGLNADYRIRRTRLRSLAVSPPLPCVHVYSFSCSSRKFGQLLHLALDETDQLLSCTKHTQLGTVVSDVGECYLHHVQSRLSDPCRCPKLARTFWRSDGTEITRVLVSSRCFFRTFSNVGSPLCFVYTCVLLVHGNVPLFVSLVSTLLPTFVCFACIFPSPGQVSDAATVFPSPAAARRCLWVLFRPCRASALSLSSDRLGLEICLSRFRSRG